MIETILGNGGGASVKLKKGRKGLSEEMIVNAFVMWSQLHKHLGGKHSKWKI